MLNRSLHSAFALASLLLCCPQAQARSVLKAPAASIDKVNDLALRHIPLDAANHWK